MSKVEHTGQKSQGSDSCDSKDAWGGEKTKFFFELTPDRVLDAVEASGFRCTGRCMALNSFENRVYDVELERDRTDAGALESGEQGLFSPNHQHHLSSDRRIVKFYRPGRWSREQILEEHEFLNDLRAAEIPAIAPLPFEDGSTLHATSSGIWYAVFPKVGGRAPDEFNDDQLLRIGRLLARVHNVGASSEARHRIRLSPQTYGLANLEYLLKHWVPVEFRARYESVVSKIVELSAPWFAQADVQRVHGDCHPGNLLQNAEGFFFIDFDDMVVAPPAQDLWLLVPGRDCESLAQRDVLLEGYQEMRAFDRPTLRLIEPLRALRFVHYTAWIARRWGDPAFPAAFPEFNSHAYWHDETLDLEEQLRLISKSLA
jgi:Ser/Thr protein kinase RdoA (MazF antagonist)